MITALIAVLLLIAYHTGAMAQGAAGASGSEVISILIIAGLIVLVITLAFVGIRRRSSKQRTSLETEHHSPEARSLRVVVLAFLLPGSCHLYLGYPYGIMIFIGFILLVGLAVFAATNPFSLYPELVVPAISVIAGGFWVGQALDCYKRSLRR